MARGVGRPKKALYIKMSEGPGSLTDYVDKIRANVNYKTANKAIKAGLKVGAVYLKNQLKNELPRSDFHPNPKRGAGATARSIAVRMGASPRRSSSGIQPTVKVVALGPWGYVYNFMHGTVPRRTSLIKGVKKKGLTLLFKKGVGGSGLGKNRGVMPKIFDIDSFFARHRKKANDLIIYSFQELINAFNLSRPPKQIIEPKEGRDY